MDQKKYDKFIEEMYNIMMDYVEDYNSRHFNSTDRIGKVARNYHNRLILEILAPMLERIENLEEKVGELENNVYLLEVSHNL